MNNTEEKNTPTNVENDDEHLDESREAEEAMKSLQGPLGDGQGFLYYKNGKFSRSDGKIRWGWWWID